jgi:uncharacterized delta-60 repeat protein
VGGTSDPAIPKSVIFVVARYNADGTPDASFGIGGRVTTDFGFNDSSAMGVAIQTDGRIVVAGDTQLPGPSLSYGVALARYTTDGQLDPTFGTAGKVVRPLYVDSNVVIQSDGRIVVAGGGIFRFNPDGSLDAVFGDQVSYPASIDYPRVALQPDGGLVAISEFAVKTSITVGLERFSASGVVDTTFRPQAIGSQGIGGNLTVQPDGKIDVVSRSGYTNQLSVERLNTDGSPDPTFGNGGIASVPLADRGGNTAIAVQIDGESPSQFSREYRRMLGAPPRQDVAARKA